ncbi:hypothetical protein HPP92_029030 [Vanilla planifolia]|uniref:Uncharacterized protein n=1 Tax=Vanilla planifolia TaxID=51239 RepID=A0A835P6B3_VANPL|nr:hypothetical protein HPP92_029030 [Vanilla planifolia]KAG0446060.1 hypothetical protein HPP92_029018 [Vanilla planifolia]
MKVDLDLDQVFIEELWRYEILRKRYPLQCEQISSSYFMLHHFLPVVTAVWGTSIPWAAEAIPSGMSLRGNLSILKGGLQDEDYGLWYVGRNSLEKLE